MGASASKIKFRESLTSLTTRDVSPSDTDFWDELWKIPSSSEEVFELLTPANARRLRDDRFENLATLFTQATAQLCQIVETPYTIYFDQALNCVRVLTRVVPFLLEKGDLGENDPNVEILCWGESQSGNSNKDGGEGNKVTMLTTVAEGDGGNKEERIKGTKKSTKNSSNRSKTKVEEMDEDDGQEVTTVFSKDSNEESGGMEVKLEKMQLKGGATPKMSNHAKQLKKKKVEILSDSEEVEETDEDGSRTDESRGSGTDDEDGDGEGSATDEGESDAGEEEGAAEEDDDDEDDNEPLALLVVHAAMHMLFLPQFTCEFYEENGDASFDLIDSDSDNEEEEDEEALLDREGSAEAGLGRPRKLSKGIRLTPRPAGIVWAPGVGFTPDGKCHVGVNPLADTASSAKNGKGNKSRGGKNKPSSSNIPSAATAKNAPVKLNPEAAYTRKYDKNRIEVLRLLLASCSDPLFSPADEYNPLASRWMAVAVAADAPNAPCLFYSLLNTVISYDPSNTSFTGLQSQFSDTHIQLVELSAQVLCVLLDCGLSGDPIPYVNRHGEPVVAIEESFKVGFNIFRVLLARINNGKDLNTLYKGFVRLLRNMFESKTTLLPSSQARLECHQELLILLWKSLEENPLFLDFILTRCDVCELVVPICYLMYVSRKDGAQVGLIHICTFILLKLSGERSFGVSLNRPFRTKLPCDLPLFSGSHADLVSITLHKIIVNGSYRLVPLYSCFLTIVCNFSPYWRAMSLVASVKLVNLFELFSSPKFLYSSEKAYRHLALLLEIFNNIIQYQYNGNQHLVYALVRRKDSFGRLASLTLPKAIYQCNKAFPSSEEPEYDADAEDQVAAMAVKDVDETGKPMKRDKSRRDGDTATASSAEGEPDTPPPPPPRRSLPGRFVPNEDWMAELRSSLPMETVNRLLQHLVPVVDEMCQRKNGVVDEIEILEVFKDITMVGLLPVPHAIVIRKYQPNQYTSIWFTAFMWGVIFLRSQKPPIFDGECIELFQVSNEDEGDGGK